MAFVVLLSTMGTAFKLTESTKAIEPNNQLDSIKSDSVGQSVPSGGALTVTIHEHRWSEQWECDEEYHWHECEAENCPIINNDEKDGYEAHSYGDGEAYTEDGQYYFVQDDNVCIQCLYSKAVEKPVQMKMRAVTTTTYPTYQQAYEKMISLKEKAPSVAAYNEPLSEGTTWTNLTPFGSSSSVEYYAYKGGKIKGAIGGVGCVAFAYILSDEVFGNLPARVIDRGTEEFTFENVKVSDILRVNGNSHSVIVLEKTAGGVIVAEGNYKKSIHWGRAMSKDEVMTADYIVTRYPKGYMEENPDADVVEETNKGTIGNITWTLTNSGTLTISGKGAMPDFSESRPPWYEKTFMVIVIEEGITSIGDYAFYQEKGKSSVHSLYIPSSVEKIGSSAFRNSNLVSADIPGSVESIGNDAFRDCENLTSVTLNEGIKIIGSEAFRACTSLNYIDFPASITTINFGAFMSCGLTRARFAPGSQKVVLGDSVFTQCWYLEEVSLPENLESLPKGIFESCKSLFSLYIPKSVTEIGAGAFTSSSYLSEIIFGGTKSEWNAILSKSLVADKIQIQNATVTCEGKPEDFVERHTHTWSQEWTTDEVGHWHECTASNCDGATKDYAEHDWSWKKDNTHHWRECTACGEKKDSAEHNYKDGICECGATEAESENPAPKPHEHEWSTEWIHNGTHHWRECMNPNDCNGEKGDYAEHHYEGNKCTECGYTKSESEEPPAAQHEHKYSSSWFHNNEYHWHECMNQIGCDGTKGSYEEHQFENGTCKKCGYIETGSVNPPVSDTHVHAWSASWSHDSSYHWHECEADGCSLTDNREKAGYQAHNYGSWVVDVRATSYRDGSRHKECTVCHYRLVEKIPATGSSSNDQSSSSSSTSSDTTEENSNASSAATTEKAETSWSNTADGKWHLLDSKSGKIKTGWQQTTDGKWYLLDSKNGDMKTGWQQTADGKWYLLDSKNGDMKTGWQQTTDGKWYLLDSKNGDMKTGWQQTADGKWYLLDSKNGDMKTGWQQTADGKWYLLDSKNGDMKTGWQLVNGIWYYLTLSGEMAKNTITPDGYKVGEDGAWMGKQVS